MALKAAKVTMPTSNRLTSKILSNHQGFSLLEILVALVLAAMIFLAVPTSDSTQKHRDIQAVVADLDRTIRFASNESVLRNAVVRIRISLDKDPIEYTVEYGPQGNLPLPEPTEKTGLSLAEEKIEKDKRANLDRQFTKVEEFEDIKNEVRPSVSILGLASTSQKKIMRTGEAVLNFYPTGEKDGGLIFFSTDEEFAYLEVAPFLADTRSIFERLPESSVAKLQDILQTRMDEVYKEWLVK